MIVLTLIPYMAITSAWAGGSLWPSQHLDKIKAVWLPEVLFAAAFAWAWFPIIGWWSIIPAAWSYIWMQTGHANALPWGDGGHNPDRENTLSPLVKLISGKLGIKIYSKNYARLFMAIKGFLITLPVGGLGIILWPLGYEIGHNIKHVFSELLSGAGAGVCICMFILLRRYYGL